MQDTTGGTKNTAQEMPAPAGADVTGGERTEKQDAGARLDDLNDQRRGEGRMERRQVAGVVESQTQHLRPSAANPEQGSSAPVSGDDAEPTESAED